MAYKATVDLKPGEFLGLNKVGWLQKTRITGVVQDIDQGFAAPQSAAVRGRLKFGGQLVQPLGDKDVLVLRHIGDVVTMPRIGPRPMDVDDRVIVDERATYLSSLRWSGRRGKLSHAVELAHQSLSSTAPLEDGSAALDSKRWGGAVGVAYGVNEALRLRGSQQVMVGSRDQDPLLMPLRPDGSRGTDRLAGVVSGLGADVKLTEDVTVSGDVFQRWTGDSAVQLGFTTPIGRGGRVYVRERMGEFQGRPMFTTIVGASDRLTPTGGTTYGEYHMENGVFGARNRALLGLGQSWQVARGIDVSAGYEHQLAFGGFLPDGTAVGDHQRSVFQASLGLSRFQRLKAGMRVELRLDRGPEDADTQSLTGADPRSTVPPLTVADHGGVALGAPLLLPPGKRTQLVISSGAAVDAGAGNTLFARLRLSNTLASDVVRFQTDDDFSAAYYAEVTSGWAFRPARHEWLTWINRYSYLFSFRPVESPNDGTEDRSHVFASLATMLLPRRIVLAPKVAVKYTEARSRIAGEQLVGDTFAVLAAVRGGYRMTRSVDLSVEPRMLYLDKGNAEETRSGFLVELGYTVRDTVRLALGYNFSRFSDNELGDLERDGHGMFVRVTGQY